jgi:hypothetical protein
VGRIVGTPHTDAEAATMQSFSLASWTKDNASASSVSATPQSSSKSPPAMSEASRNIASNAESSRRESVMPDDGALGDGGEVWFRDMAAICIYLFILGLATLYFSEGGREK